MKNWNTNIASLSLADKEVWELTQMVNYGLDGKKIQVDKIKKNWSKILPNILPARERMYKWMIWGSKS